IDSIYVRMHPAIDHVLDKHNAALQQEPREPFRVTQRGRKGQQLDFAKGGVLWEWGVKFDLRALWSATAQAAFFACHSTRQTMQRQMDDSIAAHADQEVLYDQPAAAKNRLRITGPFTVEAVPFPSVKSLDEAAGPEQADTSIARTGESG